MRELFDAIDEEYDFEKVKALITQDPSLVRAVWDEASPDTPLHLAAWQGHNEVIQLLLEHGADVNARGDAGFSPLHYAAREGQLASARLLVAAGADLNVKNDWGWTAMLQAARGREESCLDIARFLLESGTDPDLNALVSLGEVERVCELVRSDPSAIANAVAPGDLINDAVIMIGLREGDYGSDPSSEDHEALIERYGPMIKCLVEAGADINKISSSGEPALFTAVSMGMPTVVRLLLEQGADPNLRIEYGGRTYEAIQSLGNGPRSIPGILREFGYKKQ
jgi:cytohesin